MSKAFQKWNTSHSVIKALHAGAQAWIEGQPIPAVEDLELADSPLNRLVQKAYIEQTSMGWSLLLRGFWTTSWRTAQEYEFSHTPLSKGFMDNGECWAGRAQGWVFDLFDLAWGLRNEAEHGADIETKRLIRLAKCERAIRRLYHEGESLPYHESHPFREPMEDLLSKTVIIQERWSSLTEEYLPVALRRVRRMDKTGQSSIKKWLVRRHTPVIE
jgi:hypothetical protein